MSREINKDFYCTQNMREGNNYCGCDSEICPAVQNPLGCGFNCDSVHRKHPTPEQFKEEYGREVPDDFPVWYRLMNDDRGGYGCWILTVFAEAKEATDDGIDQVVCACTPFGKPDKDWRTK